LPVLLVGLPALAAQDWAQVTPGAWSGLLWSTVVPVYVAWSLWNYVIRRLGVARGALFMYLVPLIGGLAAWLWLGEAFGALKLAGAGLTLAGLALARR
jgi:drug/metabolite transporter (DMT)-like permease